MDKVFPAAAATLQETMLEVPRRMCPGSSRLKNFRVALAAVVLATSLAAAAEAATAAVQEVRALHFAAQGGGSFDIGAPVASETLAGSSASAGLVIIASVCFAFGTFVRTVQGDVAVESLRVGDFVLNVSGAKRRIKWLGDRTIDCRNHPSPCEVVPVRIAAHAFSEGSPSRDLFLSPGHPVLVGADGEGRGGHLVPIMCLINGTTIERVEVDSVTYWHVELDEHDILLAEGLPAESYIDLGSRPWFDCADGALYNPDMAAPGMPGRCRPVAIDGPVVEMERAAGSTMCLQCGSPLPAHGRAARMLRSPFSAQHAAEINAIVGRCHSSEMLMPPRPPCSQMSTSGDLAEYGSRAPTILAPQRRPPAC